MSSTANHPDPASMDHSFHQSAADTTLDQKRLARELNDRQLEAVETLDGPLLILAGAGSGKTRVITYRIARLVSSGVSPYNIIALTFTNKAAAEMKSRTMSLLNRGGMELWISTFHSACLRILRTNADRISYPKDFTVHDATDQARLIKECLKELGIPEKLFPARQTASMISKFKNKMMGPEEAEKELSHGRHREFLETFHLYEKKLRQSRSMDFDDLLGKTVELLSKDEQVRKRYRARFSHVMVDEFQDTNVVQYRLVRILVGDGKNICVVGDDDQSIYQWRGAHIGNILNFEKDFPEAKIILLEQNYRSTGNILSAAGAVVSRNPNRKEKRLWTRNDDGDKIVLYTAAEEMDEAMFVADTIKEHVRKGGGLDDVAIFYRTNSQSRVIEDTLRREGFAYQVFGGLKFYDRKEVKDLLAYFRAAINPLDFISLKRIINTPPRGIGQTTVAKMETAARVNGTSLGATLDDIGSIEGLNAGTVAKLETFREALSKVRTLAATESVPEALSRALVETGYLKWLEEDKASESVSRIENLNELVNAATDFCERSEDVSMISFLDQAALISDSDMIDEGSGPGSVKMMTVHISKGLEFPVVFVTGLEDNLFPHARSKEDENQMQEERRLLYVAMTRAQKKLYLTHTMTRRIFGVSQSNMPSGFLDDLPPEIISTQISAGSSVGHGVTYARRRADGGSFANATPAPIKPFKPAPSKRSVDGWEVGMKVIHPSFKVGVIRDIEGNGDKSKITVYFPKFGSKKLVKKYAKLEKIN